MADSPSFRELYDLHVKMVYNLCLNYLHSTEEAEEATQDVFMKVHQHQAKFDGRSSAKTWIYRIAVNQCLDRIKAKKRKKQFGLMFSLSGLGRQEGEFEIPMENHPGIQLEDKEAVLKIMRAFNELPSKQNIALRMRVMEQSTQKQIAEVLETTEKAVESLLSRAKHNLKRKLAEGND